MKVCPGRRTEWWRGNPYETVPDMVCPYAHERYFFDGMCFGTLYTKGPWDDSFQTDGAYERWIFFNRRGDKMDKIRTDGMRNYDAHWQED